MHRVRGKLDEANEICLLEISSILCVAEEYLPCEDDLGVFISLCSRRLIAEIAH